MARNLTQIHDDAYIPAELIALTHKSVTPEQFEELCSEYRELRLELTSTGELIVMPGTGFLNWSTRNANLTQQLVAMGHKGWQRRLLRFLDSFRFTKRREANGRMRHGFSVKR